MKAKYDVVVVGAGPIGSYTAYQLADKGFDVCLLEQKEKIGEDVICAGVIGKEAFKRYDLPTDAILSRIDCFTFISPKGQQLEYIHQDIFAYVVSRKIFDNGLLKLAKKSGVDIHFHQRVMKIEESSDYYTLRCSSKKYRGRAVVIATGVSYHLQNLLGLGKPPNFLYGSQIELPIAGQSSRIEIHLGRKIAPGSFGWIIPVGRNSSRIGVIVKKRGIIWLERILKERVNFPVAKLSRKRLNIKPIALGPLKKTVRNKLLVVGEAAGQVKTTTGGGIFYGLLCSEIAVEKLCKTLRNGNNLNNYEITWRSALISELDIGQQVRKIADFVDDDKIENIFKFIKHNRIWVNLLLPRIDFDFHSNLTYFCMKSFQTLLGTKL